jgi:hypothetical protein
MKLTNPNPVIIPPTPEQVFPHLWLSDIIVASPSQKEGMIYIKTLPYNQDTQSIGIVDDAIIIQTQDLWKAVNEVPEVAAVMFAIFQAVEPLRAWVNGGTPSVVTSPEPQEEVIVDEPIEE